jgi:hypothetical protein
MRTTMTILAITAIMLTIGVVAATSFTSPIGATVGGVGACHEDHHNDAGESGPVTEDACNPPQSH